MVGIKNICYYLVNLLKGVIKITKRKPRKSVKKEPVYAPSSLQERLDKIGWTKVKTKNLNIAIEEIETGDRKIFAYLWQLEEFIVSLEGERSTDGGLI